MLINKHFRRGSALLLTAAVLISFISLITAPVAAVVPDNIDPANAEAMYLYNIENDQVIYQKDIGQKLKLKEL